MPELATRPRAARRVTKPVRRETGHTPNARTIAAMEELMSGGGIKSASIDAMFEDCGIDIKKIRAAKKC